MKTKRATTITLEIPRIPFQELFSVVHDFTSESTGRGQEIISNIRNYFQTRNNKNKLKAYLPIAILGIFVITGLFFIGRFLQGAFSGQTLGTSDSRVEIKGPKAKVSLDKAYTFPLTDNKGKEIAKLKFLLEDAELREEIILNGAKASPPKGTTFLVITIKLTNPSDKFIKMKVRNYVRLSKNGNKKDWYDPTIHNDGADGAGMEIQPESTKQTRLGFPVNDTDNNLVLRVGEINGKKEQIPLSF